MIELSTRMEDYLKAIGHLTRETGFTRVKDIGAALNVKTSSVHAALHSLREKGLLVHEHYGYVRLTEKGARMAAELFARGELVQRFFREVLNVSPEQAAKDACRIEHLLSRESLERMTILLDKAR
ncbi:MAG: metal-dependent transcriptional regulator [Bacillota bacterium]